MIPKLEIAEVADNHVDVLIAGIAHRISRRLIAVAVSWMRDSGEGFFPVAGTRLSREQWESLATQVGHCELAQAVRHA